MDYKQCADGARKGPGFGSNPMQSPSVPSAPGFGSGANKGSGTSQSAKRGKQGE